MIRFRNFCFTQFNPTVELVKKIVKLNYRYIVIGDEICPKTKRRHLQGYVELHHATTKPRLKKKFPTMSIRKAKGTGMQNKIYCSKEKLIFEDGKMKKQGRRTDIEMVKEEVKKSGKMRKILDVARSYQSAKFGQLYLTYKEKKRNFKTIVIWLTGGTKIGKSRIAHELSEFLVGVDETYDKSGDNKWWQTYDAHDSAIIDDFRGDFCKYHELLKLTDRYGYIVENKGGSRQFLSKYLFITSDRSPEECYMYHGAINQLQRRIACVLEF